MESRSRKVIRNGIYATAISLLTYLLSFICRKVFVITLGTEFLGYEGLFSNVFGILAITESGFISIMYFSLYKEIAEENYEEIARLMQLHKWFYCIVGCIIFFAGTLLSLFLPYIIGETLIEWSFVYKIYFIQLLTTAVNYFFSYRRTLFTVYQEAWRCVKIDGLCNLLHTIVRILILYLTRNYYLYLLSTIIFNLLANGLIAFRYKKRFSFIRKVKLPKGYMKERGLTNELKRGFLQNVAGNVFFSTDNIVITKMLGIVVTGFYSNYYLIYNSVNMIFNKLTSGLNAAVGNYVHSKNYEQVLMLYKSMNVAFFLIGMFMMDSYVVCFQKAIGWWLGEKYILPESLTVAIALLAYFCYDAGFQAIIRNTIGHYETDTTFFVLGAVLNIITSIALSYIYGITGIVIGTIVSQLLIWVGRARAVYKYIIHESILRYVETELVKFLVAVVQCLCIYFIIEFIFSGNGLIFLLLRESFVVLWIALLTFVVCICTNDGKNGYLLFYNMIFKKILLRKMK